MHRSDSKPPVARDPVISSDGIDITGHRADVERRNDRAAIAQGVDETLRRETDEGLSDGRARQSEALTELGFIEQSSRLDLKIEDLFAQTLIDVRGACAAGMSLAGAAAFFLRAAAVSITFLFHLDAAPLPRKTLIPSLRFWTVFCKAASHRQRPQDTRSAAA